MPLGRSLRGRTELWLHPASTCLPPHSFSRGQSPLQRLDRGNQLRHAGAPAAADLYQNGIGYSSFDLANQAGVKALPIRGVAPTALAVNEGRYPCSRVLRLYTNKAKESAAALDFIRFVESPRGQEIVAQMGNVPKAP